MTLYQPAKETLAKFLFSLILTTLYGYFLMGSHFWGLGFTIINLAFLLFLIFQKPEILTIKVNLSFILGSILISLFFPFRAFFPGYLLNILMVSWLNMLASSIRGQVSLKKVLFLPIKVLVNSLGEIPSIARQFSLLITLKLKTPGFGQKFQITLVGFLVGLPLLVVFLFLFARSDPLFEKYLTDLVPKSFEIDPIFIFHTLELTLLFSLFSKLLSKDNYTSTGFLLLEKLAKYRSEVAIACVLLILTTATFLAVQLQYLFASEQYLAKLGTMLSEYTRRGYSELLIISSISLSLISILIHKTETTKQRIRAIAWVFMLEVLLVLLSASRRVYLYQSAHGFTLIRVMGVLFSLWLVGVLAIYAARLIRALKEHNFAYCLVLNTVVISLLMNLLNVDYIIGYLKQPNLGFSIDYPYILSLSSDALPGWKDAFKFSLEKDNCEEMRFRSLVKVAMIERRLNLQSSQNWHSLGSWNLADQRAKNFFDENKPLLDSLQARLEKCQESRGFFKSDNF